MYRRTSQIKVSELGTNGYAQFLTLSFWCHPSSRRSVALRCVALRYVSSLCCVALCCVVLRSFFCVAFGCVTLCFGVALRCVVFLRCVASRCVVFLRCALPYSDMDYTGLRTRGCGHGAVDTGLRTRGCGHGAVDTGQLRGLRNSHGPELKLASLN